MRLIDAIVILAVLAGTAGLFLARAIASVYEYRVQRRVARLLERNAELLEREGAPWETKR